MGAAHTRLGLCPKNPPKATPLESFIFFIYTHQARLRIAPSPSLQSLKSKSDLKKSILGELFSITLTFEPLKRLAAGIARSCRAW